MTRSRLVRLLALLPALALVVALVGCSDDDGDTTSTDDSTASASGEQASGELTVEDVWARSTAEGQDNGAVYMVIQGGAEDDALLSASVEADIAGTVEIHEVVAEDGEMGDMGDMSSDDSMDMADDSDADDDAESSDDHGSDGHGGMAEGMTMQPVDAIDVPAGDEVVLEPGGYHVMLLDLATPLVEGETFEVNLTFEQAGEITVTAEVRDR